MSEFQLFPPLDAATEAALTESIKRFGVLVPIAVDQDGNVLDGHHRKRIAEDLGRGCRQDVIEVESEAHAREIAATLNADRRQMDAAQRREVVKALREAGHSTRAIAGAVGVNQATVTRDIQRDADASPETVTGRDGKTYPARRAQTSEPQATDDQTAESGSDQGMVGVLGCADQPEPTKTRLASEANHHDTLSPYVTIFEVHHECKDDESAYIWAEKMAAKIRQWASVTIVNTNTEINT